VRRRPPPFLVLGLALAAATGAVAVAASADWRRDATQLDQRRFARLDEAWSVALASARNNRHGRELAALNGLADPRLRLPRPEPAPGEYRCRTVKLGGPAALLPYVAYGWFRCRVDLSPGGDLTIRKLTGSQRTWGNLYPVSRTRLVYLGAEAWGAERAVRYRQNPERDQVGAFERIGPRRYRLAMPFPKRESDLDLMELVAR